MTENLPSTKPYLIRAIHQWCTDNGLTPYLAVEVDEMATVPREFVREGQIVLNISYDATGSLQMGNDWISFQARFGGVSRNIEVPVRMVTAIYAKENAMGMAFEAERHDSPPEKPEDGSEKPVSSPATEQRPHLRIVK